nr:MAG TPA: hypothetical protein [Caudoviricetes sp.]
MPFRVVGAPHEVVEGYVEVVGEAHQNGKSWLLLPFLVILVSPEGKPDGGSNIFLQ